MSHSDGPRNNHNAYFLPVRILNKCSLSNKKETEKPIIAPVSTSIGKWTPLKILPKDTPIAAKKNIIPVVLLCNHTVVAKAHAEAVCSEGKLPSKGMVIVSGTKPINSNGRSVGYRAFIILAIPQAKSVETSA